MAKQYRKEVTMISSHLVSMDVNVQEGIIGRCMYTGTLRKDGNTQIYSLTKCSKLCRYNFKEVILGRTHNIRHWHGLCSVSAISVFPKRMSICVEHVAEWLRRIPQDLGVWGSIPAAPVIYKSLRRALNPHRLCPPNSNGYQVRKK